MEENQEGFDIISIGDATIDHFVMFHDAEVNCDINKENCKLSINYADKLPVDKYVSMVAGNAANNAIGSARLGLKSAHYLVVGDDEAGHKIKEKIESEGVDSRYIEVRSGEETNNSFVLSFQGERTILVYHTHHHYKLPELDSTKWVYLTSTGPGFENMFKEVVQHIKKNGIKMAYNPGTFQLRGDEALMADIIKNCEVVFVNVEEAQGILGTKDRNIKMLLTGMREMGTSISVITDGEDGAYCYDGKNYLHIAQFQPEKLETTGAGDAFGTGFVSALIHGESMSEALRWGSLNGNSVVQKVGPQAGLLTEKVMRQRLHSNLEYVPKII